MKNMAGSVIIAEPAEHFGWNSIRKLLQIDSRGRSHLQIATATLEITTMKILSLRIQWPMSVAALLVSALGTFAQAKHIVVVGCDGMSPDGVLKAKSPVMRRLMKDGAWSLHARGVMPTSSSPNWAP